MQYKKSSFSSSLTTTISLSLVSIIAIGLLTIFSLLWATDQSDKDAQAINLSGSIRMQSYRIGLALNEGNSDAAKAYIQQLDGTWQDPLFSPQRQASTSSKLNSRFSTAEQHWSKV